MNTSRPSIRTIVFAAALLMASQVTAQEAEQGMAHKHLEPEVSELIDQLKEGGHVLVIRHERTNAWVPDDEDFTVENCSTQRNLSMAGTANAIENGAVIRYLGIPIGDVYASPMCRTLETGRHMFRNVEPFVSLHGYGADPEVVRTEINELILHAAGQEKNAAMITHLGTYSLMFGGHLGEGDAAVISVVDGKPRQLGVIPANAWNDGVIDASVQARTQDAAEHSHDHN
jgi:phosphohistidine phosphatase SixA